MNSVRAGPEEASNFRLFFPDVVKQKKQTVKVRNVYLRLMQGHPPLQIENDTCRKCHSPNIIKVFIPNDSSKDCPFCKARTACCWLVLRAASLTSATISLLYASHFHDDKNSSLLINVQTRRTALASSGPCTYGFTSAIQQCLQHQGNESTLAAFLPASQHSGKCASTPEYSPPSSIPAWNGGRTMTC